VTRKKQIALTAATVALGLAAVTALWLSQGAAPPTDESDSPSPTAKSHQPAPPEEPNDPRMMAQFREAYRDSLAGNAPPGMLELMDGPNAATRPGELPPLTDPFVSPAKYNPSASSADLPPLPPELARRPELLPPPDESPTTGAMPKEGPASDLPPLPPLPMGKAPMPPSK
jgi:hypothetical protein